MTLPEAIARMEGFYVAGTRAARNNNPGNIEYGVFARRYGAAIEKANGHSIARFAYFPSVDVGFRALNDLLMAHYSGLTVAQAIAKYAPATENDTQNYINQVCHWIGCDALTPVDSLLQKVA